MSVIRACWASVVGEPMAGHSEPTQYDGACLWVAVSSSAWASRLRQREASLLKALRGDVALASLREMKVRIQPTPTAINLPALPVSSPRASRLSSRAARTVRSVAATIADPQLREALERLGKTTDDNDEK